MSVGFCKKAIFPLIRKQISKAPWPFDPIPDIYRENIYRGMWSLGRSSLEIIFLVSGESPVLLIELKYAIVSFFYGS